MSRKNRPRLRGKKPSKRQSRLENKGGRKREPPGRVLAKAPPRPIAMISRAQPAQGPPHTNIHTNGKGRILRAISYVSVMVRRLLPN